MARLARVQRCNADETAEVVLYADCGGNCADCGGSCAIQTVANPIGAKPGELVKIRRAPRIFLRYLIFCVLAMAVPMLGCGVIGIAQEKAPLLVLAGIAAAAVVTRLLPTGQKNSYTITGYPKRLPGSWIKRR